MSQPAQADPDGYLLEVRNEDLLPPNGRPAPPGKRKLFFGLCHLSFQADRWIRVVIYGLSVSLTSCLFAGWQQYSLILLKGGVYSWLCSAETTRENADIAGLFTCPRQEQAVNSLLPLASGFELAGAVAAGVLLDFAGPRICAALGSALGFTSYVMLMYSSQTVNMLALSMAVTGIAINLIGFPALTLEDYFPTAAATTAAYVIACQCVSSIISVVLWLIWQRHPDLTFHQIWWSYLLVIWIPISIPYIAMLPYKRHREIPLATDGGPPMKFELSELRRLILSAPYLIMNLLSVILMLQTSYWQLIVRSQLGSRVSDFLGYTMPSQAAWALILGRVTDFTQTPMMIGILLTIYTVVYLFVLAGHNWVQYVCVTLFNIAMSYAYTIKYTFVQERFPQLYYGTLVGITGAVSGCGVIATNILNYLDRPQASSVCLGLISILAWPLCIWLHRELTHYRSSNSVGDGDLKLSPGHADEDLFGTEGYSFYRGFTDSGSTLTDDGPQRTSNSSQCIPPNNQCILLHHPLLLGDDEDF